MSTSSSKPSASAGGASPPADKHSADENSSAGKRISVHDYHARQHKKRSGRADAPGISTQSSGNFWPDSDVMRMLYPEDTDSHDEALDSTSSDPKVAAALGGEDKTKSPSPGSRRQRVNSLEEDEGARPKQARSDAGSSTEVTSVDVESVSPATMSATPRAAIRPDGSPWMPSSQRIHEMRWSHDGCSAAPHELFND
ncbi:hypothetical protein BBI17_006496, partial [Phytophthora kernoviae]